MTTPDAHSNHPVTVGDRPQGVAGDCNSLAETHAWFDSRVAHHFHLSQKNFRRSEADPFELFGIGHAEGREGQIDTADHRAGAKGAVSVRSHSEADTDRVARAIMVDENETFGLMRQRCRNCLTQLRAGQMTFIVTSPIDIDPDPRTFAQDLTGAGKIIDRKGQRLQIRIVDELARNPLDHRGRGKQENDH